MDRKTAGELLLYFLNSRDGEISTDKLEQLSAADWDEILRLSVKHRIAPMLYHIFDSAKVMDHVPTDFAQKLRNVYLYNTNKNMKLFHQISKVLAVLQEKDIPVIVLKGASLVEFLYPNIASRHLADADMLVKAEDVWGLDSALSQIGFKSNAASLLSKRHIQWARHLSYINGTTIIEIHPKISELPKLDPWANAVPTTVTSRDTLMLSSEALLLHLCCHLDTHLRVDRVTALMWWYDIAKILMHYRDEINWDYVIRIARENDVEGSVHRVLHLVNKWFDTYVPADILDQLEDDGFVVSTDDILDMEYVKHVPDSLTANVAVISSIPSFYGRLYHLFRSVFPCRQYMIHQYSIAQPGQVYFYYPVRIARGAVKAAKFLYQLPGFVRKK